MIKEKLSLVPQKPGCYLMKNKDGNIIYVGKAKKLKNRLSSYFRGTHFGKTAKLVSEIVDFDYMVVNTEMEALILENNLIKQYDPKYNILLRDDKSYPYIELTNDNVPRLTIVRSINRKKNLNHLYGPYPNVTAARNTVNLLNRMYPLRKCMTYNKKPCLYYHINQCLGYCTNDVPQEKIESMRNDIIRFLKGDHSLITDKIKKEMLEESELMHYEKAKELKELLDYIEIVLTKQQVEMGDMVDRDVFGFYTDKGYLSIQVFFIRGSKLIGKHSKIFPLIDDVENSLTSYITKFYDKDIIKPKEILIPNGLDTELIGEYLNIKVLSPIKGNKKKIVDMACDNAKILLNEKFELIKRDEEKTTLANDELRDVLKLPKLDRIEIFDNSNLFGNFNVSGMVVYIDGKEAKNEYRKFKITVDKNDDYGTMREVIYRRYFRVLKDNHCTAKTIFGWLEAGGIYSHLLYVDYQKQGCFECLYTASSGELINNKANASNAESVENNTIRNGCGGTRAAYGTAVLLRTVSALITLMKKAENHEFDNNCLINIAPEKVDYLADSFIEKECRCCGDKS